MNLLLAAAPGLDDTSAEEAWKKIEETLERARTVTLKFKTEGIRKLEGAETGFGVEGTFVLKSGDRLNLSTRTRATKDKKDSYRGTGWAISDGSRLQQQHGDRDCEIQPVLKGFVPEFKVTLLRCGAYSAFVLMLSNPSLKATPRLGFEEGQDLRKVLTLSDLKQGPDLKDSKTLTYALRSSDPQAEFSATCTVQYDPRTWKLLGRTLAVRGHEGAETTLKEAYDSVTLDAEISDDTFTLPD